MLEINGYILYILTKSSVHNLNLFCAYLCMYVGSLQLWTINAAITMDPWELVELYSPQLKPDQLNATRKMAEKLCKKKEFGKLKDCASNNNRRVLPRSWISIRQKLEHCASSVYSHGCIVTVLTILNDIGLCGQRQAV